MYIIIFGLLLLNCILFWKLSNKTAIYKLLWIGLTLFLSLRYGQGTDYFAYNYIFNHIRTFDDVINNPYNLHGEIGFRFLCFLFGDSFEALIFTVSIFEMVMLDIFIKRYSSNPLLTLLLFYPTFYLTYYFSAIREGIVISVFIGILLPVIETRSWKKFIFITALCTTIHTVSIVLFFIPLLINLNKRFLIYLNGAGFLFGIFTYLINFVNVLANIPIIGSYFASYKTSSLGYGALIERTLSLFIIFFLYYTSDGEKSKTVDTLLKVYLIGHLIYFSSLSFSLVSSRTLAIFKIIEIVLLPYLIKLKSRYSTVAICYFIFLSSFMTYKNINSYIDQGDYYDWVNAFNYPYINIMNEEEIFNFRYSSVHYDLLE